MIRKLVFTSLLLAVACAGAVTVRQLTIEPTFVLCGQPCSVVVPVCPTGCFCKIPPGQITGKCVTRP